MKLSNWQKAIFLTFLAQTIWGASGLFVKIGLREIPPLSFLFLRSLFACLILFPLYELKLQKKQPMITPEDRKNILLGGLIGVFLNIAFYFWGQKMTSISDAWIIASTGTLFIVIYSYIFLKERLGKIVYFGVAVAFIGTLVIIGNPILQAGSGSVSGNVLMLLATIAGALGYFPIKNLITKFHPLTIVFYQFLITLILSLPFFLFEYINNPLWLASLSDTAKIIILYEAIFPSIFAYGLSNYGLRYLSASLSGAIGYFATIVAVALGIIFLGEKLSIYFLIGTVLIALGLFLAETRHPSHPIHKLKRFS